MRNAVILWVAIVMLLQGCGGSGLETYPVQGTVTLSDGTPITSGVIEFESSEQSVAAVGWIQEDGTFTMGTAGQDNGAVLGSHRVLLRPHMPLGDGAEATGFRRAPIPPRYSQYETSGLEFTVEAKSNEFHIVLEKN